MKRFFLAALLATVGLAACAPRSRGPADDTEPIVRRKSDAQGRESVAITVYNQGFGLVREVRRVSLGKGKVSLEFADVSGSIQPETVRLAGLDAPSALSVLEQNYRFDLLTPEKLLEKHVGKHVHVYRWNEALGREELLDAEVLSMQGGPVLRIGGEVTTQVQGRLAFPSIPENLIPKPTLVWLVASDLARQRVEVTYLTGKLSWHADYVMVVDAADRQGDLTGWVTLSNDTGTSYEQAELKLVAGDVQRAAPSPEKPREAMIVAAGEPRSGFRQESFFEYHLYTLGRRTSLLDKEQKQVTLLDARGARLEKKLRLVGAENVYRYQTSPSGVVRKIGVYLDLVNSEKNGLGMPLPKGTLRVYKADSSGARQFIGESVIDHTPRDEEIRVKLGESFDVVAERKQTAWKAIGACASESAWSIELRNHKDQSDRVEVYEPASGDWEILEESHPHGTKDAHTFVFDVAVPAKGKTVVSYRVRNRWC